MGGGNPAKFLVPSWGVGYYETGTYALSTLRGWYPLSLKMSYYPGVLCPNFWPFGPIFSYFWLVLPFFCQNFSTPTPFFHNFSSTLYAESKFHQSRENFRKFPEKIVILSKIQPIL